MTCVFCKGSVSPKEVEEEIKAGMDHIIVTLKAEVCDHCHERYYPEGTVDYLQKLKKELKTQKNHFKPVGQVFQISF